MTIIDALAPGGALHALTAYKQFVLRSGKIPAGSVSDPSTWAYAKDLLPYVNDTVELGFVFGDDDPFYFVDLDKCLQADGAWSPVALRVLAMLPGAYVEVSMSGKGLHIFGQGRPPDGHANRNTAEGLELYTTGRFVALTGWNHQGDASVPGEAGLVELGAAYFMRNGNGAGPPATWTTEPADGWDGPDDDAALIRKARKSTSAAAAFGAGATFDQLWTADVDALGAAFPPQGDGPYDASGADASLAQRLAFWTGRNCERIERIMRQSALPREKWNREDYMRRTILGAVARQVDVYSTPRAVDPAPALAARTEPVDAVGPQLLVAAQQRTHFAGCTYIRDLHRIYTPDGALYKPDTFKAVYGGYRFFMDAQNDKTTDDAFKAFTQSQAVRYPQADGICFRPEVPSGSIQNDERRALLNIYVPIETPRSAGDPSRSGRSLATRRSPRRRASTPASGVG